MKIFSLYTDFGKTEFSMVFLGPDMGFAGQVNGVTICKGEFEPVRKTLLESFRQNQQDQEGLH